MSVRVSRHVLSLGAIVRSHMWLACLLVATCAACSGDKADIDGGKTAVQGGDAANVNGAVDSGSNAPTLLYERPELMLPKSLHAGQEYLYWHESNLQDGGLIMQARRDGTGTPIALSKTTLQPGAMSIASDEDYVFWAEPERIVRTTHAGQDMQTAMFPEKLVVPILVAAGNHLYVAERGCMRLFEVSRETMQLKLLRSIVGSYGGGIPALEADQKALYCASGADSEVVLIPRDGSEASILATLELSATGLTLVADALYLLSTHPNLGQLDQRILYISKDGTSSPDLLAQVEQSGSGSNLVNVSAVNALYWFNGYSRSASLMRYSIDTREATELLTEIPTTGAIDAVDGTLYWAQIDPAGIWMMRP